MKRIITAVQIIGILCIACLPAFAQDGSGKVTGKLTDKKTGELLIGVTVMVQNTSKGAVTDVEGRYLLQLAPALILSISNTWATRPNPSQTWW